MSRPGIICSESEQMCQTCGVIAECRPYGKNGEQICFDCGMANEEETIKQAVRHILGSSND